MQLSEVPFRELSILFRSDCMAARPHINARLHQNLKMDLNRRIPTGVLRQIARTPIGGQVYFGFRGYITVTTELKRQAMFALNAGQAQRGD